MTQPIISFIGAGNMGSGLIGGLLAKGYPAECLWASDPDPDKVQHLHARWGIHTTCCNLEAVRAADGVVLAVKPQLAKQVIETMGAAVQQKKLLLISIMAGIRVDTLYHWLATKELPIVRCMPNMAALIHCGATALFANTHVTVAQKKIAEMIFNAVGISVWLSQEQHLDVITALSGSGPAYFFRIMEALEKAVLQYGLAPEIVHQLTMQTCYGAAQLALQSGRSLAELRQQVTSPGGTTEQGLQVMETQHIDQLFEKIIGAARQRAVELGKMQ